MAKFYSANPPVKKDVEVPLRRHFSRLPDDYHVCLEFDVNRTNYDVVIIHSTGIHVIEVKNHSRIVYGGPEDPLWHVKDDDGNIITQSKNFYNQTTRQVNALKDYLRSHSTAILDSKCQPQRCSGNRLCNYHADFWTKLSIFPHLCFPKWNRNNRIGLHHWCTLSQGPLALADRPPDILDTLAKSTWKTKSATASLSLSPAEIERLVKSLGCIQIDVRSALSDVPLWYPKHDPSVNRSSRISELESLRTTLKEEHIVAIIGEPKVGKSTIAQLLATDFYAAGALVSEYDFRSDDYRGRYAAAQLVTKFLFLEEILPQQSLQDDIAAFIEILGARDHLLILDNFESALDDAKLIADERLSYLIEQVLFNRGSLRSNILLTSTDPIRTRSRVLVPSFQLGGLTRDQAGSLLSGGDSGWTADQADLIYNIRHGHPYAIRLAATDITRYMSLGLSFSKAFESVAPEIINLTYGAIYQGFTPDEKRIVEILSLHFDGLDFEAVEYIAQRTSLKKGVASALSHLYERQAITKSGGRLFKLLPQDQQFVYSLIESPRELHAAAASYYYEHLSRSRTEIYEIAFEDVAQSAFFHAIRADQIDLAYAVFAGLEKPNQSGFPATIVSMGRRLQEHHLFESLPTSERAHVLHYNGRLLRHFGEIDAAKVSMEQALEISEQMSDSGWSASILSDLGMVLRKLGDYPRELEAYEKGLMLLGDDPTRDAVRTRSWILGRKGQALQRKGTAPAEIFECHKEALRLARQIDDPELISSRLGMLGGSYRELGRRDMKSAFECFEEAIRVSEAAEGNPGLEAAIAGLAKTHEKAGQLQRALELYLRALDLTEETNLFGLLDRYGTLGHVYKSMHKSQQSIAHYERALSLALRVKNRKAQAENLDELGSLYRTLSYDERDQDRKAELLSKALDCHQKAVAIQEDLQGDPSGAANRYAELGRTFLALERPSEARPLFVIGVRCAREAHKEHLEAWQFQSLGKTFEKLHEMENAVLCYSQAFKLNPGGMRNAKQAAEAAFGRLSSESKKNVGIRLKALDVEIEKLLETHI